MSKAGREKKTTQPNEIANLLEQMMSVDFVQLPLEDALNFLKNRRSRAGDRPRSAAVKVGV